MTEPRPNGWWIADFLDRRYRSEPGKAGEKLSCPVAIENLDGCISELKKMGYTVTSRMYPFPYMHDPEYEGNHDCPAIVSIRKSETKPLTPAIT